MPLQCYLLIKTGFPNPNAIKTEFSDLYLLPPGCVACSGNSCWEYSFENTTVYSRPMWVWLQGRGWREASLSVKVKGIWKMRTDAGAFCSGGNLCKARPEANSEILLSCALGLKNCCLRFTHQIHGEFFGGERKGWGETIKERKVMCKMNSCLIPQKISAAALFKDFI